MERKSDNEGIIVDPDDKQTLSEKSSSKDSRKKRKREVKISSIDKNTETLVITQKVEVKKQKIKCVSNTKIQVNRSVKEKVLNYNQTRILVDTSITESNIELLQNCKKPQKYKTLFDRIEPKCTRLRCELRHRYSREGSRRLRTPISTKPKSYKSKNPRTSKKTKRLDTKTKEKSLSFSLSPSPKSEISYDDVSVDSFKCDSDVEIDTLIKRTKEREKYMSVSSDFLCASPKSTDSCNSVIIISSDEETPMYSKSSVSLHSQATLVLEPQVDNLNYSPVTHQDGELSLNKNKEKAENQNILVTSSNNIDKVMSNIKSEIKTESKDIDVKPNLPYYMNYTNICIQNIENCVKIEKNYNNNNIYHNQDIVNIKEES